jgi:hypothetical protein
MQQEIYHTPWKRFLRYWILSILALLLIGFTGGCAGQRPLRPAETSTPATYPPRPEPQYEVYYVKKGDTLQSIGRRMGIPWERIFETNDCSPENLQVGQVLLIPLHTSEEPSRATRTTENLLYRQQIIDKDWHQSEACDRRENGL